MFDVLALQYDLSEDVGYDAGSEEGSVEDAPPPRKHIQPLLYMLMTQPHAFLSRLSLMSKVQVCWMILVLYHICATRLMSIDRNGLM